MLDTTVDHVTAHMNAVKRFFKEGAKLTICVRHPGFPEQDFCMTDDNLADVAAMIDRRRKGSMRQV